MYLQLEEWSQRPPATPALFSAVEGASAARKLGLCALPPGFSGATRFSGIIVLGRGAILGIISAVLAF